MIEIFSTLRFSVKHGGSVSVIARHQTFCASNLEQGGGEVPAPLVLRKAKLKNHLKKRWRYPPDDPHLMDKPTEKLP